MAYRKPQGKVVSFLEMGLIGQTTSFCFTTVSLQYAPLLVASPSLLPLSSLSPLPSSAPPSASASLDWHVLCVLQMRCVFLRRRWSCLLSQRLYLESTEGLSAALLPAWNSSWCVPREALPQPRGPDSSGSFSGNCTFSWLNAVKQEWLTPLMMSLLFASHAS